MTRASSMSPSWTRRAVPAATASHWQLLTVTKRVAPFWTCCGSGGRALSLLTSSPNLWTCSAATSHASYWRQIQRRMVRKRIPRTPDHLQAERKIQERTLPGRPAHAARRRRGCSMTSAFAGNSQSLNVVFMPATASALTIAPVEATTLPTSPVVLSYSPHSELAEPLSATAIVMAARIGGRRTSQSDRGSEEIISGGVTP